MTGESTFSSGLFPDSTTATVDLGGMQGSTSSMYPSSTVWYEDSAFSDRAEGSTSVSPLYNSTTYSHELTYYKDSAFTVEAPAYTLTTTNDPASVAYYSDTTFQTQIVSPNSGTMRAVILTWNAADYPNAAERAGDGLRWSQVYFPNKYNGMNTNTLVWDTANYQAKIEFGSSGQAIDSTWHGTAVQLRNRPVNTPYFQVEFRSDQGLTAPEFSVATFEPSYNGSKSISSASLVSGQIFNITMATDITINEQTGSYNNFYFSQNDIPSLYLQLQFSSYNSPSSASDINSIEISGVSQSHSSIVSGGTFTDSYGNQYNYYNVTFSSVPSTTGTVTAVVGTQELRYFQDISAKRAMRIKSLGSGSAPTSNGTGDSALYVKQCPVNYSGSHADELFYLDAAGNTIQFTEGGHVFAPRRAMDATEVLAEDADLSSLPTLASSLKECYAFDLSAKAGSPALGSSSQAQALTIPVPQAADIGREVKIIVLGSMSSANQLTINAGTYTNSSSASITGQIDGLDAVILSQPYQVIKLLAIKAQDDAASADITCWKLV